MFEKLLQKHADKKALTQKAVETSQPLAVQTAQPLSFKPFAATDIQLGSCQHVRLSDLGVKLEVIRNGARAAEVIASFQEKIVGLDIETYKQPLYSHMPEAGLSPHLSGIRTVQLYEGEHTAYVIDLREIGSECLSGLPNTWPIAHNALFEMNHLRHIGVNLPMMHCTMLMDNAITNKHASLQDLMEKNLNMRIVKDLQCSDWGQQTLSPEQLEYAAIDALACFKLYEHYSVELRNTETIELYALMQNALWAVSDMSYSGLWFNMTTHSEQTKALVEDVEGIKLNIAQTFGKSFNPNSPTHLGKWIAENVSGSLRKKWPKTDSGAYRTNAFVLSRHSDIPEIALILKYKKRNKLISAFGTNLANYCNPGTGRIHSNFKIAGAETGRMTCSKPSLQNLPRDKAFRRLFEAPQGRKHICADYSQMELRIVAELSQDPLMKKVYQEGGDLHRCTAMAITGREDISAEDRQCAKAANFGLLYGQKAKGFIDYAEQQYNLKLTKDEAQKVIDSFFGQYQKLGEWQASQQKQACYSSMVKTVGGRTRCFGNGEYFNSICLNFPVQGSGAEVLYAALGRLSEYLKGLDAHIVNCVHDEILLEASEQDAIAAKSALERAMMEGFQAMFPDAPTLNLVDAHIGSNWAEAKG